MTREEQIAARSKPDGQAVKADSLDVDPKILHPEYDVQKHDMSRSETGLLRMFSLTPKTSGKPQFQARWDDGGPLRRNKEDVDFDIQGVDEKTRSDFKACRNGYSGHHTVQLGTTDRRVYEIEITIPTGTVFKGTASFALTFAVDIQEKADAVDTVSAVKGPVSE